MGRGGADQILYGSGLTLNRAGDDKQQDASSSERGGLFELEIGTTDRRTELYAFFFSLGRFGSAKHPPLNEARHLLDPDDPALRFFDRASSAVGAPVDADWSWYSTMCTHRREPLVISCDRAEAEAALQAISHDYRNVVIVPDYLISRLKRIIDA